MRAVYAAVMVFAWVATLLALAASCSSVSNKVSEMRAQVRPTPSPRAIAKQLGEELSDAGFVMLPADTDAKRDQLQGLVPLKVSYFIGKTGKMHYWMADPYFCHCLYHGDDQAFQRFENRQLESDYARREAIPRMDLQAYQQEQINLQLEEFNPYGLGFTGPGMVF